MKKIGPLELRDDRVVQPQKYVSEWNYFLIEGTCHDCCLHGMKDSDSALHDREYVFEDDNLPCFWSIDLNDPLGPQFVELVKEQDAAYTQTGKSCCWGQGDGIAYGRHSKKQEELPVFIQEVREQSE